MTSLTDRQRRFIEEYTVDYNGPEAAKRAGFEWLDTKNTARILLSNPDIVAAIRTETQQLLLRNLWVDHKAATAAGQWSASIHALEIIAKLTSNLFEQCDLTVQPRNMTTEDKLGDKMAHVKNRFPMPFAD